MQGKGNPPSLNSKLKVLGIFLEKNLTLCFSDTVHGEIVFFFSQKLKKCPGHIKNFTVSSSTLQELSLLIYEKISVGQVSPYTH